MDPPEKVVGVRDALVVEVGLEQAPLILHRLQDVLTSTIVVEQALVLHDEMRPDELAELRPGEGVRRRDELEGSVVLELPDLHDQLVNLAAERKVPVGVRQAVAPVVEPGIHLFTVELLVMRLHLLWLGNYSKSSPCLIYRFAPKQSCGGQQH